MNICIATNSVPPGYGGGGMRGARYARLLAERGHDVSVLTRTPNPNPIPGADLLTIQYPSWPRELGGRWGPRLYDPLYILRLARLMSGHSFDVVHCIGAVWKMLQVVWLSKAMGWPVALEMTTVGSDDPIALSRQGLGTLKVAMFRMADRTVSISPALDERCKQADIPDEQRTIVPNSVDRDRFTMVDDETQRELKRDLGLEHFHQIIVSVGVIRPRKNQEALVDMFAQVADDYPKTGLVLVGPTDKDDESRAYTEQMRDQIDSHGLSDRVVFSGYVEDVERWLQASDIFAFASHYEGFPSVLIEAMSVGLPCVVKELDYTTDYIFEHGVDGFTFETYEQGLAYLEKLLESESQRQRVGRRASETVASRFTDQLIMDQYETLYRELADDVPPNRSRET